MIELASPRYAVARLVAGAVLISFSPVWVTLADVDPTASAFWRLALGGVLLLLWLALRGERIRVRAPVGVMLLLAGGCFALDLFFWHRSILIVGAGVSTLLANFQVFILAAAAFVLFGQRLGVQQLLAVPVALLGLAMIVGLEWQALPPQYRLGIVFGLLTAVSYAAYILALQAARLRGGGGGSPMGDVALASLAGAVALAFLSLQTGETLRIGSARDAALLSCYALGSTVFGWVLISSSLAHVSAARVGLILLLQPTLSFFWDVLFFGRGFTGLELTGALIALVAIHMGARRDSRAGNAPGALPSLGGPERPPR